MSKEFEEMERLLWDVAKVNDAVTRPVLEKKTGLKVLDEGEDHGQIVTEADKNVSLYLLDGGIEGVVGLREEYPGSFSEEDDDPSRPYALRIFQVDPLDGTGDFKDTYKTENPVGPTTLVSRLDRHNAIVPFEPSAGMIFDVYNRFALISDGRDIGLYTINEDGVPVQVDITLDTDLNPNDLGPVFMNRRLSYCQHAFEGPYKDFLRNHEGIDIQDVNVGGAGTQAMHLFRNYIQPAEFVRGFSDLAPISVIHNAQPDWKTWDTDPNLPFAWVLGLEDPTDLYGEALQANAAKPNLTDMHHRRGYMLSTSQGLQRDLASAAREFELKNPFVSLLEKDYGYSTEVVKMAQGK